MSRMKVVELRPAEVNTDLLEQLDELRKDVAEGKVTGVAAVVLNNDKTITTLMNALGDRYALSYGISAMWLRLHLTMLNDTTPH